MNRIFLALSFVLGLGVFFALAVSSSPTQLVASEPNLEIVDFHHSCSGTGGIGGSCSATCTDSQGCACSSGFFSCTCSCSSATIQSAASLRTVAPEPGPKENWITVAEVLQQSSDGRARSVGNRVMDVYNLSKKSAKDYNSAIAKLEKDFQALPANVKTTVTNSLEK